MSDLRRRCSGVDGDHWPVVGQAGRRSRWSDTRSAVDRLLRNELQQEYEGEQESEARRNDSRGVPTVVVLDGNRSRGLGRRCLGRHLSPTFAGPAAPPAPISGRSTRSNNLGSPSCRGRAPGGSAGWLSSARRARRQWPHKPALSDPFRSLVAFRPSVRMLAASSRPAAYLIEARSMSWFRRATSGGAGSRALAAAFEKVRKAVTLRAACGRAAAGGPCHTMRHAGGTARRQSAARRAHAAGEHARELER